MAGKEGGGNKVTLEWLWKRLKTQGLVEDVEGMWERIQSLCLQTLVGAGGDDTIPHQPNAFEVFGFDVILDDDLKAWLIEVNSCPALSRENELDSRVKESLIEDTIRIVSPLNYNRVALAEICERRLCQKKRSNHNHHHHNKISVSERDVLEQDLRRILNHELPRQYGEEPRMLASTGYQRLAPGPLLDRMRSL